MNDLIWRVKIQIKEAFEEEDIDELVKSTYEEIIDGME